MHTPAFIVIAAKGRGTSRARLGCAVSKRVGHAPTRARVRRLLREVFRRMSVRLPAVDLVVIAKPAAAKLAGRGLSAVADLLAPALERAAQRAMLPREGRQ